MRISLMTWGFVSYVYFCVIFNQEYIKIILTFKMEEKTHPGYPQDGVSRLLE